MKLWSDKLDQGLLRSRLRAGVTKNIRILAAAMFLNMADKHNVPLPQASFACSGITKCAVQSGRMLSSFFFN
jgi:hypothetical protein